MRPALLLVLVAACGGESPPSPSCDVDRAEWRAIMDELPKDCVTTADCALVGGSPGTCSCSPHIGACVGEPVNAAAYAASGASAYAQHFIAATCEQSGICDCEDYEPQCVDGTCIAVPPARFCLGPPDAGIDAAADAGTDGAVD